MDFEAEEYSRFSHHKTSKVECPYVVIRNPIDAIPYLIEGLPEGDLPIIFDVDGVYHKVKMVKKSLLVLKDILTVRSFELGTENGEIHIDKMDDILESDIKWT